MGITLGEDTPRENLEQTRVVRALYRCLCEQGEARWGGHTLRDTQTINGMTWWTKLATRGSKCTQGQGGRTGVHMGPNAPRRTALASMANTDNHMGMGN
jgi:hypothetical protein